MSGIDMNRGIDVIMALTAMICYHMKKHDFKLHDTIYHDVRDHF